LIFYSSDLIMMNLAPFIRKNYHASTIMYIVCAALIPAIMVQVYYFGIAILIQISLSIVTCLLTEALCLSLRKRPVLSHWADGSALLTALLISLSLPSLAAWWVVVLACFFSLLVGKHLFGGLGQNTFNPAMVGLAMIVVCFPAQIQHAWSNTVKPSTLIHVHGHTVPLPFNLYVSPKESLRHIFNHDRIDASTYATPLNLAKNTLREPHQGPETQAKLMHSMQYAQSLPMILLCGAYFIGGLCLVALNLIKWRATISMLVASVIIAVLGTHLSTMAMPWLFYLLTPSLWLACFFIVTDPVTSPTTHKGLYIYGVMIALITYLIRTLGNFPDGIAFAVLMLNMATPFIDRYTQSPSFGRHKRARH
jgi:electron transport complex protein RnfD